jgi:hypothetical protein
MITLILILSLAQNVTPTVPGRIDPAVTQANIKSTICRHGYTKTVRPPASFTNKLKFVQMTDLKLKGKPEDFEEDHRVPLEVGGAPMDPENLWPQPYLPKPGAKAKDRLENAVAKDVCAGRLTLKEGQAIFLGDFWKEYQKRYGE